jgi:hypothetical protein
VLRDVYTHKNFIKFVKKDLTEFKLRIILDSNMVYFWSDLDSADDRYGIKEALGESKLPHKLALAFDLTSPQVWGNVVKGRKASGIYGEIIASIKHWGYKEAVGNFTIKTKNKFLRHIKNPD